VTIWFYIFLHSLQRCTDKHILRMVHMGTTKGVSLIIPVANYLSCWFRETAKYLKLRIKYVYVFICSFLNIHSFIILSSVCLSINLYWVRLAVCVLFFPPDTFSCVRRVRKLVIFVIVTLEQSTCFSLLFYRQTENVANCLISATTCAPVFVWTEWGPCLPCNNGHRSRERYLLTYFSDDLLLL
jgi:hypothetical protein